MGFSVCERVVTPTHSDSDSDSDWISDPESESESTLKLDSDLKLGDTNNDNIEKATIAIDVLAGKILRHKLDETELKTLS